MPDQPKTWGSKPSECWFAEGDFNLYEQCLKTISATEGDGGPFRCRGAAQIPCRLAFAVHFAEHFAKAQYGLPMNRFRIAREVSVVGPVFYAFDVHMVSGSATFGVDSIEVRNWTILELLDVVEARLRFAIQSIEHLGPRPV